MKDELQPVIQSAVPTPPVLLQMAIQKGTDIAQLEKLMELQERWEKKEARKTFFDALSRFQQTALAIKRNKKAKINMSGGGSYEYGYADLGAITQQIKKALRDSGLSYRWEMAEENGKMKVTCLITHRDGHTETTTMEAGLDATGGKNAIQQKGSTHTYLQRYTLIGALGLSTADEDNDGKTAAPPPPKKAAAAGGNKKGPDSSVPDYLQQWADALKPIRNKTELQTLYLKNRSTVDGDTEIQKLFKIKQGEVSPGTSIKMP